MRLREAFQIGTEIEYMFNISAPDWGFPGPHWACLQPGASVRVVVTVLGSMAVIMTLLVPVPRGLLWRLAA